ncbi:MAG: hypothetical protein V4543_09165 [Bacteroidota bacterium]
MLKAIRVILPKILIVCTIMLIFTACKPADDASPANNNNNTNPDLFTNFKISTWNKKVDCSELNFPADSGTRNSLVYFTSASTNTQWVMAFPSDSSELFKPGNIGRHKIVYPGYLSQNRGNLEDSMRFTFGCYVPVSEGSPENLRTWNAYDTLTYYNKINSVTLLSRGSSRNVYVIKGEYKGPMVKTPLSSSNPAPDDIITGSYAWRVSVLRR